MRKILTSVLSVAGLLAVVLALASSPASAATKVVVFTTPVTAGEYTITWETAGGCSPGEGTSGASGSVSVTVRPAADDPVSDPPVVNEQDGTAGTQFVTVNNDCSYKWSASLVDAASKANCEVGVPPIDITEDAASVVVPLTALAADGAGCAPAGSVTVTVGATQTAAAVNCTEAEVGEGDGAATTGPCAAAAADDTTVKTDATYDAVSPGAIAKSTFTVTATPARNSHAACQAVSDDTSVEAGVNSVKLSVVGANAIVDGKSVSVDCVYNIKAALPVGFAAAGKSNEAPNVPSVDAPGDDATDNARTLTVTVAQPRVILVQQVDGDSEGGVATYRWSDGLCAAGLPDPLGANQIGGINPGSTTVELREGRFDITAAVDADGVISDLFALDKTAASCNVRATVKNLPDHCSAANPTNVVTANLADDATSDGIVFVNVAITCEQPVAEAPAPAAPADTGGDDMGGADDMDDGADDMDDGADDMDDGADDMDDGADDMDDGADDMDDGADDTDDGADDTDDGAADDTDDGPGEKKGTG